MLKGFRDFIMRGNVIDLAVGVVIGAAFNSVVSSLVKDFITPLIAAIAKAPDFSSLAFVLNGSKFMYGDFVNSFISFLLTAAAVYFFVVLPINKISERLNRNKPVATITTKACSECLSDIPLGAKRCPHCTSVLNNS